MSKLFVRRRYFINMLAFLFFQSVFVNGQTIEALDTNGGFKDFKIGDPKSKWQQLLGPPNSSLANTYNYTGDCCKTAFGYSLKKIGLSFNDNDKLEKIWLFYKDRQQADGQTRLYNTLVKAFGKPTSSNIPDNNSGDMNFQWEGKKIVLAMINKYKGATEGGWEITIMIVDERITINPSRDY